MTNIFCTLGPACASVACLEAMIMQGLTGVRLNLSHTSLEENKDLVDMVHTAFSHCEKPVRLLIDLQGPELRVGTFASPVPLTEGTYVELSKLALPPQAFEALRPGQEMLLDDGKILLVVEDDTYAFIKRGGLLSSRKNVAIPGLDINLPPLTESDLANIAIAQEFGVTGVMQPFVHTREELDAVSKALDDAGAYNVRLYAKLENTKGLENLAELLPAADEFVIARGDLGNAMPLWDLPAIQKDIADACKQAGRPFMVATQLISSMETNAVPSRAEISDIFNAVLDGATSLMATGETAVGAHPVEVVRFLANTARAAEAYLANKPA